MRELQRLDIPKGPSVCTCIVRARENERKIVDGVIMRSDYKESRSSSEPVTGTPALMQPSEGSWVSWKIDKEKQTMGDGDGDGDVPTKADFHMAGTCSVLGIAGVPIAESVGTGSGFFSPSCTPSALHRGQELRPLVSHW